MLFSKQRSFILIILAAVIFLETAGLVFSVYTGHFPGAGGRIFYGLVYIWLSIFYLQSIGFKPFTLDYGFLIYITYPLTIPYALLKQKGWLKGSGFILLWIIGYIIPSVAASFILAMR